MVEEAESKLKDTLETLERDLEQHEGVDDDGGGSRERRSTSIAEAEEIASQTEAAEIMKRLELKKAEIVVHDKKKGEFNIIKLKTQTDLRAENEANFRSVMARRKKKKQDDVQLTLYFKDPSIVTGESAKKAFDPFTQQMKANSAAIIEEDEEEDEDE